MRKIGVLVLALFMTGQQATLAFASSTVKFTNQKSGMTCQQSQLKKTVVLPNKKKLICKQSGGRNKWVYVNSPVIVKPITESSLISFGGWGETNFAKFSIVDSFSLDSIGINSSSGPGTVFLVKQCLQNYQPANPIGTNMSTMAWTATDEMGRRITASTIVGPRELVPAYPSLWSDLIMQPGECISGHMIFFSDSKITELNYVDDLFGGRLKFAASK